MEKGCAIRINVFDLHSVNECFRKFNLGLFHTQICFDDKEEYCFGVENAGKSGVQKTPGVNKPPKRIENVKFYMSVEMGRSSYDLQECLDILHKEFEQDDEWQATGYNMVYHNCNTFTMKMCERLLTREDFKNYPFWVSRVERFFRPFYSISLAYVMNFLGDTPIAHTIPDSLLHDSNPKFD